MTRTAFLKISNKWILNKEDVFTLNVYGRPTIQGLVVKEKSRPIAFNWFSFVVSISSEDLFVGTERLLHSSRCNAHFYRTLHSHISCGNSFGFNPPFPRLRKGYDSFFAHIHPVIFLKFTCFSCKNRTYIRQSTWFIGQFSTINKKPLHTHRNTHSIACTER